MSTLTSPLTNRSFPIVYQDKQPTAVLVDIESFRQMELILDNLLHREVEPEDALIASARCLWEKFIGEADVIGEGDDWEKMLDEL